MTGILEPQEHTSTEHEYLLCSRCPTCRSVTEDTFFMVAADWMIKFDAGRIIEVICPICQTRERRGMSE